MFTPKPKPKFSLNPEAVPAGPIFVKAVVFAPQTGQRQFRGSSLKGVSAAMSRLESPLRGS